MRWPDDVLLCPVMPGYSSPTPVVNSTNELSLCTGDRGSKYYPQYLRQISGCRNDRYRITKTQAAHRYVYQGQIIPDLVFPDTFMMPHSGFEDYSQNMRAYYFWAIDSGFRVRKPSVTALTFWRRYCILEQCLASLCRRFTRFLARKGRYWLICTIYN